MILTDSFILVYLLHKHVNGIGRQGTELCISHFNIMNCIIVLSKLLNATISAATFNKVMVILCQEQHFSEDNLLVCSPGISPLASQVATRKVRNCNSF